MAKRVMASAGMAYEKAASCVASITFAGTYPLERDDARRSCPNAWGRNCAAEQCWLLDRVARGGRLTASCGFGLSGHVF